MRDAKKDFYDNLEDVRAGMLGLASDGKLVPMSPNFDDDEPEAIWFITAQGTDLVNGVSDGPQPARFVVAEGSAGLYADIDGMLSLSTDQRKLDDIWSSVADAWFEDGRQDPDVRLLKFAPTKAEAWITSTSGVKFFYEIIKAKLTDETPDTGEHVSLTF